jgi:hypothetical protein
MMTDGQNKVNVFAVLHKHSIGRSACSVSIATVK